MVDEVLLTVALGVLGYIGVKLIDILTNIKDSIEELNVKIALVIAKTDTHEKRLDKLEEKLT